MANDLPPCGLYVTREPVAGVAAGRLVYFHNHGDPGAGVYLPSRWSGNRALFEDPGFTIAGPGDAMKLEPVPMQGYYRVVDAFYCCEKQCQRFEPVSARTLSRSRWRMLAFSRGEATAAG